MEESLDELYQKFHVRFEILTNDRIESAVSGNVFTEINLCIAKLDKLARNAELQEKLKVTDWDLMSRTMTASWSRMKCSPSCSRVTCGHWAGIGWSAATVQTQMM